MSEQDNDLTPIASPVSDANSKQPSDARLTEAVAAPAYAVTIQHRSALVLLIKSALDQIDEISALQKQGASAAISQQMLKETCSVLIDLSPELTAAYLDTLVALSDSFGVSALRGVSEEYSRAVVPAKRQFIARIKESLKVA